VFLVRHAEKQALPREDDPPLTEAGARRAEELARILGAAEIRAIYTSQYLRTKQTAEPLARQLGIAPTTLAIDPSSDSPDGISPESIQRIADQVYAHAGEPALIVGHSNTIPLVIRALGGDIVPTIEDSDFNDLFVVVVYAKGKARVTHLEFGAGR
jgi:broad specificity phosphatase PhoE